MTERDTAGTPRDLGASGSVCCASNRRRAVFGLACLLMLSFVNVARAHDFTITDTLCVIKSDGIYVIDMSIDVDALALGVSPSLDSFYVASELEKLTPQQLEEAVAQARDTIARRVRIRFDGVEATPSISFPQFQTPLATSSPIPTVMGTTARLTGRIPALAKEFTFGASRAFNVVHLTIFDQHNGAVLRQILDVSENSQPYLLDAASAARTSGGVTNIWRYLTLGFEHILPKGLDHILFVTGLFLLSVRLRPLLWQITAFTVAHSVTLALSMLDIVSAPSWIVESLIALSISYVAIENIITTELKPWRPALVFGFGLLHGMGFAGVLRELGLPKDDFVAALVSFNVGVEFGQLTVVAIAFLLVGWFRNSPRYRTFVVIPASIMISLIGLYWTFERSAPALFG